MRVVFGILGDGINGVMKAAAFMTGAYAKYTGKFGNRINELLS